MVDLEHGNICDRLEKAAPERVLTQASITAKGFFEKRGFVLVKKQYVERQGKVLTNFIMEKSIKQIRS